MSPNASESLPNAYTVDTPTKYIVGDIQKSEVISRGTIISSSNRMSFVVFEDKFFVKVLEAIPEDSMVLDRTIMPSKDRIAAMEHEIGMMEQAGRECAFQPLGRVLLGDATVGYITNLGVCLPLPKTLPSYYFHTEILLGGPSFNVFPTEQLVAELFPLVNRLHERGVLHGDIKPPNILYSKSEDRFLFCDFGSARLRSSQARMDASTTAYVTPARARAETSDKEGPLSREDDLYATGITLWELATCKNFDFYDADADCEYDESVVAAGFQPNLYEVKDVTTRGLVRSLLDQGFPPHRAAGFDLKPYTACIKAKVVYSGCLDAGKVHTYSKIVHCTGCEGDNKCRYAVYEPPSPLGHVEQLPCTVCSQ